MRLVQGRGCASAELIAENDIAGHRGPDLFDPSDLFGPSDLATRLATLVTDGVPTEPILLSR